MITETTIKPKSRGLEDAEAQLLAMAQSGVRSEIALISPPPTTPPPPEDDLVNEDDFGSTDQEGVGKAVKRRFGITDDDKLEKEEGLTKKVGPMVRPSTWIGVRKLEIRLEEMGSKTSLNRLADAAFQTLVTEMNRGLDGNGAPDPDSLLFECVDFLKPLLRGTLKPDEIQEHAQQLLDKIEAL